MLDVAKRRLSSRSCWPLICVKLFRFGCAGGCAHRSSMTRLRTFPRISNSSSLSIVGYLLKLHSLPTAVRLVRLGYRLPGEDSASRFCVAKRTASPRSRYCLKSKEVTPPSRRSRTRKEPSTYNRCSCGRFLPFFDFLTLSASYTAVEGRGRWGHLRR